MKEYRGIWALLLSFCVLAASVGTICLASGVSTPDNIGRSLTEAETEEVKERNSPLTDYIYLSPNATFPRESPIKKLTIHHMAGDLSLEELGASFGQRDRQASANYAVDSQGRVGMYVEENNAPWTSSNSENDRQAVTIEVANDEVGGEWHVSDEAYEALLDLCTDICRRNGIEGIYYTGDSSGNLTTHNMFAETDCPGPYLSSRLDEIAREVTRRLRDG